MTSQIPQLDIAEFDLDPPDFVLKFGQAYREWGFAGITGHGIPTSVIENALNVAQQFFSQPELTKAKYLGSSDGFNRGYIPFGTERAKDSPFVDLKEFFHVGKPHLEENIWPGEVSDFQHHMEAIYASLEDLAKRLLMVIALYLELDKDYFEDKLDQGETLLRAIHYPPIDDPKAPNVRAAAHEDINLITLLVGSEQAGLEVLSRQGTWVPIGLIEGTIVCNVGDMLQRLTNNRLPSTTHRVVNPQGDLARSSRYSIPFFVHPSPDMKLDCLPQCVNSKRPCAYPAITAGEYLAERLQEIGLKK